MLKQKTYSAKDNQVFFYAGLVAAAATIGYQAFVSSERQALIAVFIGSVIFLVASVRFPVTLAFNIILYESLLSWRQVEQIQILGHNRLLFYAVFVGTFLLAVVYRVVIIRRRIKLYWIDLSTILLVLAYVIAFGFAVDKSVARPGFTYFFATMLSFYIVRLVVLNRKDVYIVINFLLGFMLFEAVLGCLQVLTNTGLLYVSSVSGGDLYLRATGTLGNGLGWYLTIGYILSFNLWLYNRKSGSSRMYFVVLVGVSLGLIVANTRGAWVDCAFATMISLIPILKAKKTKILLIFIMLFVGMAALLSSDMLQNRVSSLWSQIFNPGQSTIGFRFYIWQAAFGMFEDYPISGVGPDNFKPLLSEYVSPEAANFLRISEERSYNVHHAGLQVLSETGLVGVIAFVLFIFSYLSLSVRLFRRYKFHDRGLAMALFVFSIMSTISIVYGGYSYGGYTQVGSLYFLLVGITVVLAETIEKTDVAPKSSD